MIFNNILPGVTGPSLRPTSTVGLQQNLLPKTLVAPTILQQTPLFDVSDFSSEITRLDLLETQENIEKEAAQEKIETSLSKISSLKKDIENLDGFKGIIDTSFSVAGTVIAGGKTISGIVDLAIENLVAFGLIQPTTNPLNDLIPTRNQINSILPSDVQIPSVLPSSVQLSDLFGVLSTTIGLSTDISTMVLKSCLRSMAMNKIEELKKNISTLSPDEVDRLEELVKVIQYEDEQFNQTLIKLGVKTTKSLCSYTTFSMKWMTDKGFASALSSGISALGSGLGVVIAGVGFHEARQNVKVAQKWAENLDNWIRDQDPTAKERAVAFEHAKIEHENELGIFHEKVTDNALSKEDISAEVIKFKSTEWVEYHTDAEVLAAYRDKKIEPVLTNRLERHRAEIENLQLRIEKNELSIEDVFTRVGKFKSEEWMNSQTDEIALLSAYIDYHSVLDPTVKNALAQMVTEKQEIQESFLKEKRLESGISLTASAVMFAVATTFAVIGLVATPVGAAALVLTVLGIASTALSIGLFGAGCYHAYKLQPNATAAFLWGDTVRLMYYNARSAISEVKQGIKDYVVTTWQENRNRLATFINSFATEKLNVNQELQVEELIGEIGENEEKKIIELKQEIVEDQAKEAAKVNQWRKKADDLAKKLEDLAWKDFADYADLQIAAKDPSTKLASFDTLETLNEVLANCDFDMLSPATKELLKDQLGINVRALQKSIKEDPQAVKKALLTYFFLDDSSYAKFVKKQTFVKNVTSQKLMAQAIESLSLRRHSIACAMSF